MKTHVSKRARRALRRRHQIDRFATAFLGVLSLIVVTVILSLIIDVFVRGFPSISWHFLTAPPSEHEAGGGIGPEIFNSLYILVLTLLCTVPIALAAAIYLTEYAPPGRVTEIVGFSSEVLATVPSIVMGLFGLLLFVYVLRWRFSALGGALTLTLLNVPAMMRVATVAFATVPSASREASLALGATRWQTIRTIVVPGAAAQLLSGVVLIAGRIFGETAALIYTAGVSVEPSAPYAWTVFHPAETLSVHLWYTHAESVVPDVARIADGSAFVLVAMVLLFNLLARGIARVMMRRSTGR